MAPPWYEPLPPTMQGLSPEVADRIFNTPEVSFGDVLKEQDAERQRSAALIAQKLNNQVIQEALAKRQQDQADQAAREAALKQQFSGIDPNNFDPTQGLKIAQGLMLQQGDLDSAIEAAKASRMLSGGGGVSNQPLDEQQLQEFGLPPGSTVADARLSIALKNATTQRDKITGVDNRFNTGMDFKKSVRREDQAELIPPGFKALGPGPDRKSSEIFKKTLVSNIKVSSILDDLEESVNATGQNVVSGNEYVKQRALVNDLALELKRPEFANLGAALGPAEWQLLINDLPKLMSTPGASIWSVLVDRGMGRDATESFNVLRDKIQRNLHYEGKIRNIVPLDYTEAPGSGDSTGQLRDSGSDYISSNNAQQQSSEYTPEQQAKFDKYKQEALARLKAQQGR